MTYTEIQRQAALDPHLQARGCHDAATAALRFDQARARMWGLRRYICDAIAIRRHWLDVCGMVGWAEVGIMWHHYGEARRQAIIWRKRLNQLEGAKS